VFDQSESAVYGGHGSAARLSKAVHEMLEKVNVATFHAPCLPVLWFEESRKRSGACDFPIMLPARVGITMA
jgi:hypothetical protein